MAKHFTRLLFWLLPGLLFGAGSVQQTTTQLGNTNTWVTAFQWTGDASTGAVPVTSAIIPSGCNCQGYLFTQVEVVPGSPSPTSGYSLQILDAGGADILNGAAASLSATTPQAFAAAGSATPLQGSFRLSITGQSVASAKGTVYVFFSKPGTINLATIGSGGGGGNTANWLTIANPPFVDPRRYNFTPQSPGGTLSAGSCSFTLSPVPSGVVVGDMLYITGTGTPEQVPVTNVVGGTVTATCGGNHAAGFSVMSNSAGINEAINVAAAAGGGTVYLTPGSTTTGTINLPNGSAVMIQGEGITGSTLLLRANTNADLLTNYNFASLTGSNTAPAGIYRVTVADVTLDGNQGNQSGTSWCFRVYGHGYTLRDMVAQNCLSGGMYSEYAVNPSLNTPLKDLETYWHNIRVKVTSGDNIVFRGPHDSYLSQIVSDEAGGRCFVAQGSASYNGNVHLNHFDGYNCSLSSTVPACEVDGVALVGAAVTCSGSMAGSHGLYLNGAQSVNLTGANLGALGDGANGLNIGTVTGSSLNYIQGIITSSSTAAGSYALSVGLAQNNIIDGVFSCPATGPACINITANDQGAEVIRGTTGAVQQLLTGTVPPTDNIQLQALGTVQVGPQSISQIPMDSTWHHYHIAKVSGNWIISNNVGTTSTAAAAALTQSLTLDALPVGNFVDAIRIQTATAFTGTTTANVTGIGNGGSITLYYSGSYNLETAVSSTNLVDIRPNVTLNVNTTQNLQFQITTTGANVSSIADGAAVDFWVKWGALQ